jgi:hypothetical protein
MSYSRFGRYSDWYIYRKSGARKLEDETLVVWHVTAGPGRPATEFSYAEVSEMLERNDFSRINCWSPSANDLLREALGGFVGDGRSSAESAER